LKNPTGWNIGSQPNYVFPLGFTINPYVLPINILGFCKFLLIMPMAQTA